MADTKFAYVNDVTCKSRIRSLVLWFEHCGMTELYHMRGTLEVAL